MSFTLLIKTGDAAMVDTMDVSNALRDVANSLELGYERGTISDDNGNHVGHYLFARDDQESANFTLTAEGDILREDGSLVGNVVTDAVLGHCEHGVDLDRAFCPEGCRR